MAGDSADGRLPATPLLGGRYRLESRVGSGGMGVVYRAIDESLGRTVAVKLFRDSEAADLGRKTSETRLLAALNHPSLVTLYDARIDGDGDAYLVMEYVDGPTLRTRIADGPVSSVDAARMARDLGEALHVVHSAGVVHRDIKPANVLLRQSLTPGEEFTATLADFGIAHLVGSSRLTTPGTLLGTAAYLSPEQVRGSEPAPPSDIYSLGLVLLEALTGERVFGQSVVHEAALARLTQDPDIPGSLGYGWKSLLTEMTARDPEARPTALEVAAASRDLRSDGAAPVETTAAATVAAAMPGAAVTQASPTVAAQEPALEPTRVMAASDEPTRAMAASDEPTVEFGATAASSPSSRSRRPRRWGLLLAGVGAAAVIGAVLAWTSLMGADSSPAPATTPSTSQAPAAPETDSTTGDDPSTEEPVSVTDPVEPEQVDTTPVEPEPVAPAGPGNGNDKGDKGDKVDKGAGNNGNGNGKGK